MLELSGVTAGYANTHVLGPLTLAFEPRRTAVILGPSGCGKSTLLKVLLGLVPPSKGSVQIERRPLDPASIVEHRRRMGYVIQEGGLFPHLTAERNVSLMARQLDWSGPQIADRLGRLTELVRLEPALLTRFPSQLSGGQRQRVSLMRALMLDPDVLLLDEPLTALDPMVRRDLQDDLAEIFSELGKTVLLVTHDLAEAAFFADRIVLMRDGAVVQDGTFADLERSPADPFVTRFFEAQHRPLGGRPGNSTGS